MYKPLDQLTEVEQLCCEYSDFHKEVYGSRAYLRADITLEEAKAAMARLAKVAEVEFARQDEQEKQAIARFEELLRKTVAAGAKTRRTALRWVMDASNCDGDWEHLCYNHGLPYGYFRHDAM